MKAHEKNYILKGDIVYSKSPRELCTVPDGFLVCKDGVSGGVYASLEAVPEEARTFPVMDYSGHLIVPGLVDLHLHAPQYMFRGTWMDLELLDWLNVHTFPEEAKYREEAFAEKAYRIFAEEMRRSATARFCAFATIHVPATLKLMDLIEESGLIAYIGKVNMDRNSPDYLCEDTEASYQDTVSWLESVHARGYRHVKPILTPRFIPSCTDALMERLGRLIQASGDALPLQSHLSENQSEIAWVKELCPWSLSYGDAYDRPGCFGGAGNGVIMAHCVWLAEDELARIKKNGVFVAHCPASNTNLASGIAPVRRYLDEGVRTGLGSDIAGGTSRSIFRAMADAVQVSKLRWRLSDQSLAPLTLPEAFYLGTKGGGAFFGRTGSFEAGYAFDALVLDESQMQTAREGFKLEERLERFVYLSDDRDILHKYVDGDFLF